ncbi:MAG: tRNA methyl transferase-domain-containing protein [Monoraphidium minutum]|nr:MAG: tRNA methyl transferase-domain-containing protein [Monoraphidium minutum]
MLLAAAAAAARGGGVRGADPGAAAVAVAAIWVQLPALGAGTQARGGCGAAGAPPRRRAVEPQPQLQQQQQQQVRPPLRHAPRWGGLLSGAATRAARAPPSRAGLHHGFWPPADRALASAAPSGGGGGVRGRVVAVALSGGVDSAAAALLLRRGGADVFGVYMRNWDAADEVGTGAGVCTSDRDLEDAKEVARKLRIPLLEADFVGRYWNDVFSGFLSGVAGGVTPNPDLTCNAAIKFGALWEFAAAAGADALATGHYARLGRRAGAPPGGGGGGGGSGDQSYFLAGVSGEQLARAVFPVGHMLKSDVRALAAAEGLGPAAKRSSAGICFIGRRPFGEFIQVGHAITMAYIPTKAHRKPCTQGYLPPRPGRFRCADTGADLGACANVLALTHGQRAPLGGGAERRYVAGKDVATGVVWVAPGRDHPALLSDTALLAPARWVAGGPPAALAGDGGGELACSCQARYRQEGADCIVSPAAPGDAGAGGGFRPSRFMGGAAGLAAAARALAPAAAAPGPAALADASPAAPADAAHAAAPAAGVGTGPFLELGLARPLAGMAPGQAVVLYEGDVVLGSALLVGPGETQLERGGGGGGAPGVLAAP